MNFTSAITICIQKYVDFGGRATRREFWFYTLFVQLLFLCSSFLDPYIAGVSPESYYTIFGPATLVVQVLTLLPSLSVTARRLQDTGASGWWMLIALTGIGLVPLIYWLCDPSDETENSFGESPLDVYGEGVTSPVPAPVKFVLLPITILVCALSVASIYFFSEVMDGGEMGLKVYSGDELSEEHLSSLRFVELINLSDEIQYFYSDELGTVDTSGQFVTQDRVVSFYTDGSGDLIVYEIPLEKIDRVEEVSLADELSDSEHQIFGSADAEHEFITVFLPVSGDGKAAFLGALGAEIP